MNRTLSRSTAVRRAAPKNVANLDAAGGLNGVIRAITRAVYLNEGVVRVGASSVAENI